jgi:transposase-like protein
MKAYLDKITPNVADAWRADELYLKVRGNPKYLYAVMDDQTLLTLDHYSHMQRKLLVRDQIL